MFRQVLFWAENQDNHQNFKNSLLSYKLFFMRLKQLFFQFKMADKKKAHFPESSILNILSRKFHGLVFWLVGLIYVKGIGVVQPIWPLGSPT
jgi:hypothetical protein